MRSHVVTNPTRLSVIDCRPSEDPPFYSIPPPSHSSLSSSFSLSFLSCTSFSPPSSHFSLFIFTNTFRFPISLSLFFANFLPLLHHSFPHFDPPPKPVPTTRRERERTEKVSRIPTRKDGGQKWPHGSRPWITLSSKEVVVTPSWTIS